MQAVDPEFVRDTNNNLLLFANGFRCVCACMLELTPVISMAGTYFPLAVCVRYDPQQITFRNAWPGVCVSWLTRFRPELVSLPSRDDDVTYDLQANSSASGACASGGWLSSMSQHACIIRYGGMLAACNLCVAGHIKDCPPASTLQCFTA